MKWESEVNWILFAQRVLEKGTKISLKDAKESNIPDGIFFEMCARNLSEEQWKQWANTIIKKMG